MVGQYSTTATQSCVHTSDTSALPRGLHDDWFEMLPPGRLALIRDDGKRATTVAISGAVAA